MSTTILFCDASGLIVRVQNDPEQRWANTCGLSLASVLEMDEAALMTLARRQEVNQVIGPRGLNAHLTQIPPELSPVGGYVVCLTRGADLGLLDAHTSPSPPTPTTSALDYAVFNAVFNDARDAIILTDHELRILAANRKANRIFAPAGGQPLEDAASLLLPEDRERVLDAIHALKSGKSWRTTLTVLDRTQTPLPAKLNARCLSAGDLRLYQFMLRDLSGRMALEQDLAKTRRAVAGMNIALKHVLLTAEEEKQELKDELVQQVREELLPAVGRLAKEESPLVREAFKSALEEKIADMTEAPSEAASLATRLTPREIDICRLIQQGWQGRDMAEELGISFETLQSHRKNIRRKLNLRGRNISLSAFLQQQSL